MVPVKAPGQAGASGSLADPEAPGGVGRPDDHAHQAAGRPVSLAGTHRARPDQVPGRAGRAEPSGAPAPGPAATPPGSGRAARSRKLGEATEAAQARSAGGRSSFLVRHAVFGVLLVVGVALRLAAVVGFRPAFEFSGDSYAYIRLSELSEPDPMRPAGYPAFLRVLVEAGADLWVVPVVQHLLGLLLATALYALLVHRRVATPIAAVAAAPLLLDAYQVVIEHFVMAETVFAALLVAAVVALMWSRRPSVWALALAGLLLGASGLVRTIGVALGLLAFGYVVARRLGWLRVSVFGVFLAAPLIAYASWFSTAHGSFGLTGGDAAWLYGRVAPIADCAKLDLRPEQLALCSPHPVGERPDPSYYVWDRNSPANRLGVSAAEREELLRDFARQVITAQPTDYLNTVGTDIAHFFRPGRPIGPQDWPDATWRFPTDDEPRHLHNSEPLLGLQGEADRPARDFAQPWAGVLRSYQTRGYTPGPALAAAAGLGLLACLAALPRIVPAGLRGGDGRARWHDLTSERRRTGLDCLFLVAASAAVVVIPAATVCFDYRYMLPLLFLLPPAAALATRQGQLLVLAWRERRTAAETPWRLSPGTAPDDRATPDAPFRLDDPFLPVGTSPAASSAGWPGAVRPPGPSAAAGPAGSFYADPPTIPGEPVDDHPTEPPVEPGPPSPPPGSGTRPAPPPGSGTRPGPGARSGPGPRQPVVRPRARQTPAGAGGPAAGVGPAGLPKRPPGVTYEARERQRRPSGDGTSDQGPTAPVPARPTRPPVSRGPDARMPTPAARTSTPEARSGGSAERVRPRRSPGAAGSQAPGRQDGWDQPTTPPDDSGGGEQPPAGGQPTSG
ncbi:hypothetical protein MXD63_14105 [Frankia sp. Cpl3]|uniref:hypothetical protein n=1 Tax=Parafrankia colletiae TaxID=573497 RepID=UPI000AE0F41E|nr:hypothetical protein [Parafrankia colletiae]MCK9901207.1 hypothetical protein [Frankia sp. Cpl3]